MHYSITPILQHSSLLMCDRRARLRAFRRLLPLPLQAGMNGEAGNRKAEQAKRKGPVIGSGQIEEIAADPSTERASQAETNLEKTEDETDFGAGKNISNHRTVR